MAARGAEPLAGPVARNTREGMYLADVAMDDDETGGPFRPRGGELDDAIATPGVAGKDGPVDTGGVENGRQVGCHLLEAVAGLGFVAFAVAALVVSHSSVGREKRQHPVPDVSRRRKAMDEDDRGRSSGIIAKGDT